MGQSGRDHDLYEHPIQQGGSRSSWHGTGAPRENRERDRRIETDLEYALQKLKQLKNQLEEINPSGKLLLHSEEAQGQLVATSIERELIYCLDHAIHHQALIKIGLKELNLSQLVHNDFGVAYSTLRYRASI